MSPANGLRRDSLRKKIIQRVEITIVGNRVSVQFLISTRSFPYETQKTGPTFELTLILFAVILE